LAVDDLGSNAGTVVGTACPAEAGLAAPAVIVAISSHESS
jgi:hypothetical protein